MPTDNQHQLHEREKLLRAFIENQIISSGPISFSQWMGWALNHPDLGYYSSHLHPIGSDGDFITAPELSPYLANCISQTILSVHQEKPITTLLELGAGTGQWMVDILINLDKKGHRPQYLILETSAERKQEQQTIANTLPKAIAKNIEWIDELPKKPFQGIILANEVIDALPVERFMYKDKQFYRWMIDRTFNEYYSPWEPPKSMTNYLSRYCDTWPNAYQSEYRSMTPAWINSLSRCINSGLILIIDYGYTGFEYYHPERSKGTLRCFHQHQCHNNPLTHLGQQDITADVDFTNLAKAATDANLRVTGYISQAHYLINTGLLEQPNLDTSIVKTLLHPNQMGERFKVMGLGKNLEATPNGFEHMDQSHLL